MQSSYGQIHGLMSGAHFHSVSQPYHVGRFELTVRELAIVDLISESHHIYELGVVDNFVLTKLIFGISTIYT
jgi:hypothetical protein